MQKVSQAVVSSPSSGSRSMKYFLAPDEEVMRAGDSHQPADFVREPQRPTEAKCGDFLIDSDALIDTSWPGVGFSIPALRPDFFFEDFRKDPFHLAPLVSAVSP